MFEVLVGLTILLLVVTIVGHGIWILVAAIVRALAGEPSKKKVATQPCATCGRSTPSDAKHCAWCGVLLGDQRLAEMSDYAAFVRHLDRMVRTGVLDRDEAESLRARAMAHRAKTLRPTQPATPEKPPRPKAAAPVRPAADGIPVAELVDEPEPPRPAPTRPAVPPVPAAKLPAESPARVPETPPPPATERPKHSWAQLLEAFMEERNMRWGELIGGLLIVGGGVALAISLREQLQAIPYSQFIIFAVITAAIHGAGLYSHYRWRLANTSRGLLTVAMLLTPVSFLIMAQLAGGDLGVITLGVEAAGLAALGYLNYLAARVVVPDRPGLAVLGTLGHSAVMLPLAMLVGQPYGPVWLAAVALLPTGVLLAVVGGYLARRGSHRRLNVRRSTWLLILLGVSLFAWVVAEGHCLAELTKRVALPTALELFAVPLTLAAAAVLLVGLVLLRRTRPGEALEGYRTTGTTMSLIAMVAMLAAIALAWPWPEMILAVTLLNALVLAVAAMRYRVAALHSGVIFCTAMALLVGYHATFGHLFGQPIDRIGRALLIAITSAPSGNLLGGLFVVSAIVAEWFVRSGRRRDGQVYAIGCGVLAVVGVSLVTWHGRDGGGDALRAAILYAVYGLISVALAARWNKRRLSYLGLALVQGSMLWAAWWQQERLWLALLAFATLATVVALVLRLVMRRHEPVLRRYVNRLVVEPCVHTATVAGAVALYWLLLLDPTITPWALAGYSAWLAVLATVLAFLAGSRELMAASQATWAIAAVAAARCWLAEYRLESWPTLRTLQIYGIALAAVPLAWGGARIALRGNRPARRLLDSTWPTADQIIHHALVLAEWFVLVVCLMPHVAVELGLSAPDVSPRLSWPALDVGTAAWLLLGMLAVGSAARLLHRFENVDLFSLLLLVATAPTLLAGRFADELAVASDWRWTLAAALLGVSAMIWNRHRLARPARRLGIRSRLGRDAVPLARSLMIVTTALPIVAISATAAVLQIVERPPAGPVPHSVFGQIGPEWSYLVPLVAVVLVLVGYALRDRSAIHAFAAGAVVELAAVLGYLLVIDDFGQYQFLRVVQILTIASAAWAVAWLAARRRLYPTDQPVPVTHPLLTLQVAMPVVGQAILCLLPIVLLVNQPLQLPERIAVMNCPTAWAALLLTVAAAGWQAMRISRENALNVAVAAVLGAIAVATCHTAAWGEFGSYYFLTTAMASAGLLVVLAGMAAAPLGVREFVPRRAVQAWAAAIGSLVVLLSTIHCLDDPHRPWWFASTLLSVSVVAGMLAVWLRRTPYVFASGVVLNILGSVVSYVWYDQHPGAEAWQFIEANVLCLAAGSAVWSLIALLDTHWTHWVPWPRLRGHAGEVDVAQKPSPDRKGAGQPTIKKSCYHTPYTHLAAATALAGSLGLVVVRLAADVVAIEHVHAGRLSWISLAATAAALAMLLADRRAGWSRAGLYLTGLAAVGLGLDARWLDGRLLAWTATMDLACFALVAALVGWALTKWLPGWQWPRERFADGDATLEPKCGQWFSVAQQMVVVVAAVLAGWVALDQNFDVCVYSEMATLAGRVVGPIAAALLLAAALVMAVQTSSTARGEWQLATLLLVTVVLCCSGWWLLPSDVTSPWIHKSVILLAAAALGAIGSGALGRQKGGRTVFCSTDGELSECVPTKNSSDPFLSWLPAARWATAVLGGLTIVSLAWVLGLEVYFNQPGGTPMDVWAIVTVAATLAGIAAGLIAAAVLPGVDLAGQGARRRTVYVYAAEVVAALLGVHMWLVRPEWFELGIIEKYWIYLVMGVAFLGAGLAEWFERRGVGILAQPLERTALALPAAAAVGFWLLPAASPAFWFVVALFYGVMAVHRHNGWLGFVSVLTGNMGLWVLWQREQLHFIDRPQLWLIPAALCALVAERIHHNRLKEAQSAAIRYMALSVIYVSSTVEFLRGVGESVWLPLILVGLSVAGVMAGIVLRVRSFVYLGVTFLMVVIVRMILYAAFEQGQMWIFWSAVTCLGLAIFALFALFEKRRNDVQAALDRFKRWEN